MVFIQETQSWLKGWILINETILIKNSGKSYDHISGKSYHINKCRKGFWLNLTDILIKLTAVKF